MEKQLLLGKDFLQTADTAILVMTKGLIWMGKVKDKTFFTCDTEEKIKTGVI